MYSTSDQYILHLPDLAPDIDGEKLANFQSRHLFSFIILNASSTLGFFMATEDRNLHWNWIVFYRSRAIKRTCSNLYSSCPECVLLTMSNLRDTSSFRGQLTSRYRGWWLTRVRGSIEKDPPSILAGQCGGLLSGPITWLSYLLG